MLEFSDHARSGISKLISHYTNANLLNSRFEEVEAVDTDENVAVGIHFEQVAERGVEPEATCGECGVILKLQEILGVAQLDQALDEQFKTQDLERTEV